MNPKPFLASNHFTVPFTFSEEEASSLNRAREKVNEVDGIVRGAATVAVVARRAAVVAMSLNMILI